MPNEIPFYVGRVKMTAFIRMSGMPVILAEKDFDHGTKEGRFAVRNFVHYHLLLGHEINTSPLS